MSSDTAINKKADVFNKIRSNVIHFLFNTKNKLIKPTQSRLCDVTVIGGNIRCSVPGMRAFEKVLFWFFAALPLMMADLAIGYIDPLEPTSTNLK